MGDIDGIILARGLPSDHRDTADALLDVNRTHRARNERLVDYYEGDVSPSPIGIEPLPDDVRVDAHCDWPRKAVTSVSERSRLDGFVFANDARDESLERVVRDNGLVGAYNRHVHSELIHGCMFATVGRWGGRCVIRFHTAETSAGIWDDSEGRLGAGLVVADTSRTSWSPRRAVPVQVNMHLPGLVVMFRRQGVSEWSWEELPTPLDRPAMEAFAYRPTGLKPFGCSRIDKTVMSITDAVIRTLQNMEVSSALYASPQKALLGLTDEAYDALTQSKMQAYLTRILLATKDDDGDTPTLTQLAAASPQPYIDLIRSYAMLFSGATGVPLNSLGIVQDNPSSAQAIESSREDICIAAQDLNESNGESLRAVALMAMAVEGDCGIDGLTDAQRTVVAKFADPSMPSIVSQADAAVKVASVAPWVAESDVFLEMLGFDEGQRRRLATARAMASTNNLLAAFGGSTNASQPGLPEAAQ